MLKTRGGNRFEGYGNVKLGTEHGTRSGWQLICYECQGLSEVIHRTGSSYPPKVLARMFSDKGWKVGQSSASDVCPACLEKRRERAREERKQYAKGNVDRLLDMIRQIDLMLASNVTIDYGPYQPQIAAQLKSLFETAYLCNMMTTPEPLELLRTREHELEAALNIAKAEYAELQAERDQLAFDSERPMWKPEPPPEEPPPPAPKPSPPPPPAQEGERIAPRTAAFLADIRKQIFKGVGSVKPYGANENTDRWMTARHLQYRPRGRCLHWVSRGRCGVRFCDEGHRAYDWMDHVSGWIDDNGKRMLLCQPYHVSEIKSLIEACEKFALRADIHGTGWYGHGTIAIELRPKDGAAV